MSEPYDIAIIGGGVNGAGIARDAAGRGLKAILIEAKDLASATSSNSTKIIHGGLRYLEHYDFGLVRQALKERETLIKIAPHIIWPLQFILPHQPHLRPAWMIQLGLFIYDHLAKREILPDSQKIDLTNTPYGKPLVDDLQVGFSYYDGWVQDSRLVALNAVDAKEHGADIYIYAPCTSLTQNMKAGLWDIEFEPKGKKKKQVQAKAVVNATGPWVDRSMKRFNLPETDHHIALVKGSHIVTKPIFDGDHCYILQNEDGRIVFAFSYEGGRYSYIGTTDVAYEGDPRDVKISEEEIVYLCGVINDHFKVKIGPQDVVASYAGVRPLLEDGNAEASKKTRDYKLEIHDKCDLPLLNIFGGKITTYRKLSEKAVNMLSPYFPDMKKVCTATKPLPGGDIPNGDFDNFIETQTKKYPWLDEGLLYRYARAYGTRMNMILKDVQGYEDMGEHFGDHVFQVEIDYLQHCEFAKTAEDILWRRSKLVLHIEEETKTRLKHYLGEEKS